MFLVENYVEENTYPEITADPICGMEIIQEAEENMYNIDMAMIKLEHDAIMHEDASLLVEGEESFGSKVKEVLRRAWEKFKVYLEKVYVAWTSIQSKLMTTFVSQDKVKKMFENVEKFEVTVSNDADLFANRYNDISNGLKKFSSITGNLLKDKEIKDKIYKPNSKDENGKISQDGLLSSVFGLIKDENDESKGKKTVITKTMVINALSFIKKRKDYIQYAKNGRKEGEKLVKEAIDALEEGDPNKKQMFTKFQRYYNALIIYINKVTILSVKICRAALKVGNSENPETGNKVKDDAIGGKISDFIIDATGSKQEDSGILDYYLN